MACYKPIQAWRGKETLPSGKTPLVFSATHAAQPDNPLEISCGGCVGCRLERSRQWAIRITHEASLHEDNIFLTLTYNNETLLARDNPKTLVKKDFQDFMKRLRANSKTKIRYYHCGEYGGKLGRPHYHAILFGYRPHDEEIYKEHRGKHLYRSNFLDKTWGNGFCNYGEVTFQSAAYVARYVMKKINGEQAEEHYKWVNEVTGEIQTLQSEYTTMSRRPGIGKAWYDQHKKDLYPNDTVVINGRKMRPPKYYDTQFEKTHPFDFDELKYQRELKRQQIPDESPERLATREKSANLKLQKLKRALDDS